MERYGDSVTSHIEDFGGLFEAFTSLTAPVVPESNPFESLLVEFSALTRTRPKREVQQLTTDDLAEMFARFEDCRRAFLDASADHPPSINIWELAHLGRNEVRNCRVLKWLLDPDGSHCQSCRFLKCLLEVMGEPNLISEGESVRVRREVTMHTGDTRIDILIESESTILCIEAKIGAKEDHDQLNRYAQIVGQRASRLGKGFSGRLLTASGTSGQNIVEGFKRLLWSDVAKALQRFAGLVKLPNSQSDHLAARSPFVGSLAGQYAAFLRSHVVKES